MLCIRKMDLVDLTARPFVLCCFQTQFCVFIFRMNVWGSGAGGTRGGGVARGDGVCFRPACSSGMCRVCRVTAAGVCEKLTDVVKAGAALPAVPSRCPHRDKNQTPPSWQQQKRGFHQWGVFVAGAVFSRTQQDLPRGKTRTPAALPGF